MLGFAPEELESQYGKSAQRWLRLLHPDDQQHFEALLQGKELGKESQFQVELKKLTREGDWKWVLCTGKGFFSDSGTFTELTGITLDIDDAKNLEGELVQAKEEAESATRAKV